MKLFLPGPKSIMSKKSLLIWILLLLIVAVLKTSASDAGDEINHGNGGNEGTNWNVADYDDGQEVEHDNEGEEGQVDLQNFSLSNFLSQNALPEPGTLLANIIGGAFNELPEGMLISLPPEYIFELLSHPLGARHAASLPFEIFTESNYDALIIDMIHDNFFINLDLFSQRARIGDLSRIPSHFVIKTIQIHSREKKLNF